MGGLSNLVVGFHGGSLFSLVELCFGSANRVHIISKLCSCGFGSLGYRSGSGRDLRFVKHLGARA